MANESLLVSEVVPATPSEIFAAWLDSDVHSAITGDAARIQPFVGGAHSAFDGYATGQFLRLEEGRFISATWRTAEFPEGAPDSKIEVSLEETVGGTTVTLLHTEIPEGQAERYRDGWIQYYLQPLRSFFVKKGDNGGTDDGGTDDGQTKHGQTKHGQTKHGDDRKAADTAPEEAASNGVSTRLRVVMTKAGAAGLGAEAGPSKRKPSPTAKHSARASAGGSSETKPEPAPRASQTRPARHAGGATPKRSVRAEAVRTTSVPTKAATGRVPRTAKTSLQTSSKVSALSSNKRPAPKTAAQKTPAKKTASKTRKAPVKRAAAIAARRPAKAKASKKGGHRLARTMKTKRGAPSKRGGGQGGKRKKK